VIKWEPGGRNRKQETGNRKKETTASTIIVPVQVISMAAIMA